MIERGAFGEFTMLCDFCSAEDTVSADDNWSAFIDAMRGAGWKSFQKEGEWRHMCPTCLETGIAVGDA